ncbi:MAG TPA: hypothetical protein VEZ46_17015 [Mycobacteriales bacterium]|jgi:hypothetical protein|nr:hypothetical protein [Mycobacteriales bacterium]
MVLTRRICALLLAAAAFMVLSWLNFARNLLTTDDDHPRGYYIAHTLLILANLAIAGFLVWLASRGMKHYDDERVRQFYDDRAYDEARKSARKERAAAR